MQATAEQIKIIHTITPNRDIKEEWVQWATEDVAKISCKDLTFDQANKILVQNNCKPHKLAFWAYFDKTNTQHTYIRSLCINYGWVNYLKGKKVADMDKLNEWMHSDRCPVKKKLQDMTPPELSKLIVALESMTVKKHSKPKA